MRDFPGFSFIHINTDDVKREHQGKKEIIEFMTEKEIELSFGLRYKKRECNRDIHDALMVHGKDIVFVLANVFQTGEMDLEVIID